MACCGTDGLHVSQELPQAPDGTPEPTKLHHSSVDAFESTTHASIIGYTRKQSRPFRDFSAHCSKGGYLAMEVVILKTGPTNCREQLAF
jgi:hypothetical protein